MLKNTAQNLPEAQKLMHSEKKKRVFFSQAVFKLHRLSFSDLELHTVKNYFYSVYKLDIMLLSQGAGLYNLTLHYYVSFHHSNLCPYSLSPFSAITTTAGG